LGDNIVKGIEHEARKEKTKIPYMCFSF